MIPQRWLRIIPVALIMYTISYVDRTNISLALDPKISGLMKDLLMDDKMKGHVAGIFFLGYVLLQIPGGYWASRWSARKIISLFLIFWGLCAVGCGLSRTFRQFEVMRFLLGVAESGVFPATLVLLANWCRRAERARANAYWCFCQPLALASSAPFTGWLLGAYGWQRMMVIEGLLPFLWLPLWWAAIRDHPREAKWISKPERDFLETTLQKEMTELEPPKAVSLWRSFREPLIFVMLAICFLYNCEAYGCMTFFTSTLGAKGFTGFQYGVLLAVPYALTAAVMIFNSWHSDRAVERRGHVALLLALSRATLTLSVTLNQHFWLSYALLCLAIPGPFAALGPFWSIPGETLPPGAMRLAFGLVNAFGNLGGYAGQYIVGWLKQEYHSVAIPFVALGLGMLLAGALAFLLPKAKVMTS